jgi:hypothetical protein
MTLPELWQWLEAAALVGVTIGVILAGYAKWGIG